MAIKGGKIDVTLLVICLVASLSVNAYLFLQVKRLQPRMPEPLEIGGSVPKLEMKSLAGEPYVIHFAEDDRPTVLYVFTPSCPFCLGNLANIKYLAEIKSADFRVIGISLEEEGLDNYMQNHTLNFAVFKTPSDSTISAFKLGGVPHTIVVSPQSKVLKEWRGAYTAKQQQAVEKYFGLSLPGFAATGNY